MSGDDDYYYSDGSILAYRDNNKVLHRENGPAIELSSGYKSWFINGKRHRVDGPAVECCEGKVWYIDGKRHREDGPAVEHSNGDTEWYINGKKHRIDGPAVEWDYGGKAWYVDDEGLSEKDFNNHPKVLKYKYEQQFYQELEKRL